MSVVAMARATSTTTIHLGMKSQASGGGGGATPNRHLAKPSASHNKDRDDRAVVLRVNEHLTVGSRGCHGLSIMFDVIAGRPQAALLF